MKFTFTGIYNIDLKKERERIIKCFGSPEYRGARDRQMAILDALEVGDMEKVYDLYDALPRCEIKEYPEQEYVGMWITEISDIIAYSKFDITDQKLVLDDSKKPL